MSITSNIANVAGALTNSTLVDSLNAGLLNGQTGTYYLNTANSSVATANTQMKSYVDGAIASANTLINYTLGVDVAQNTRISTSEGNITYLQGALNQTNTNIVTANTSLKSYVDGNFFLKTGGDISGPVTINSSLLVTGNLTVSGNVTSVSANNLVLKDNMIYLNEGGNTANPDLGISGAYNDGTYHHAGFFRDATDGVWKVYDNYLPEPDVSPWIDTSNSSFRIANFQANTITANVFSGSGASLTSIPNSSLVNTSITINGTAIALGGSGSIVAGATITDDNSTNAKRYLMLGPSTSGSYTVANTSSSKLSYNPYKGEVTANAVVATSGMLVHSNIIYADYTLDANNNAISAGPIGVANGVTVTVSSGSTWTIV